MNILLLQEHQNKKVIYQTEETQSDIYMLNNNLVFSRNENYIQTSYYVGIDSYNNHIIIIEPKLNKNRNEIWERAIQKDTEVDLENTSNEDVNVDINQNKEVDLIKMLLDICQEVETHKYISKVVHIRWNKPRLQINQQNDFLNPFLITQYLLLLKEIVRKGLKKSNYRVTENLNAKVKGKILIHKQVKQNLSKGIDHKTVCNFQVFDVDSLENRFLKKVLRICSRYIAFNPHFFKEKQSVMVNLLGYCESAFSLVSDLDLNIIPKFHNNPIFKEYKDAIRIGEMIIRNNGYNPNIQNSKEIHIHPFWIDMPMLFELFVLTKLRAIPAYKPKEKIHFQYKANRGNIIDFLLNDGEHKYVIDAKYKTAYKDGGSIKDDMRQLAGYARLNAVYRDLNFEKEKIIPCLIIYPSLDEKHTITETFKIDDGNNEIKAYNKMYAVPLYLPIKK